jgi:hypothetical protein
MTIRADCVLAESLAGAIAVGEANETERDAYRGHLASCSRCVSDLGGEKEIERVMSVLARAREDERWEPDLRAALRRGRAPHRAWRWGLALATAVLAIVALRATETPRPVGAPAQAISAQEARALAVLNTQTASQRQGRAESLTLGGGATLSTAFEVNVDERGTPLRCRITVSSGDRVLDRSICSTAMRAHYSVQTPKGR